MADMLANASEAGIVFALRLPDLERIAWRDGRASALATERKALAAFAHICRRTLRWGDTIAHEPGTNLFLAALRECSLVNDVPRVAHAVLAEITRRLTEMTGLEVEGGWTLYEPGPDAECALRQAAKAALERGRRERERYAFFAAFGHEMRTPLTSIDGFLSALLEAELDPPTRRRFIEIAQLEAVRLRRLVESMYALSLIDLDAEIIRNVACSVQKAVEDACDAMFPMAARRGTRVRVLSRVDGTIPLADEHAVQLFASLLENAVKHGRENGRIDVHLRESPGHVVLFFDDDGPGVAADQRTAIFAPLARGRGATAAGHGLGLSIVRSTVERTGGDVTVTSSPLGGARFVVRLPRTGLTAALRKVHPN